MRAPAWSTMTIGILSRLWTSYYLADCRWYLYQLLAPRNSHPTSSHSKNQSFSWCFPGQHPLFPQYVGGYNVSGEWPSQTIEENFSESPIIWSRIVGHH